MAGSINLRISKIVVLVLAILDIIFAVGFLIKAAVDKNYDYKYIHNETEWNLLYFSLIASSVLIFVGIFKPNVECTLASCAVKFGVLMVLLYAVVRGKLENLKCERELCRYSESSACFACYGENRKNKYEYDFTSRWALYFVIGLTALLYYAVISRRKPKRYQQAFTTSTSV